MEKITSKVRVKITRELDLPEASSASISGNVLTIKGPKGEVRRTLNHHNIFAKVENKKIFLESASGTKKDKKLIGSLTAHIKNMMRGSTDNHTYIMKICSGHFPMNVAVSGKKFSVKNFLGEKVPRVLHLKDDVDVKVEGELVYVKSPSKELAGQVAADIEQLTRRPGYDTRIFQDGIYITSKDGKELK